MNLKVVENLQELDQEALARGQRLRACRIRHGYCIREFSQKLNIPESTLYAWEKGRSPLSLKGAKKIIAFLEGTLSSGRLEWLMYGETSAQPAIPVSTSDDILAIKDVNYFVQSRPNSVVKVVLNDALSPCLLLGDYVGGVKVAQGHFEKLEGVLSILETLEGDTYLGVAAFTRSEVSLYSMHDSLIKTVPMEQVNYLASITWIRRKDTSTGNFSRFSAKCLKP